MLPPINLTVKFEQSDMADRAALMPHATRTIERRVEYVASDMVTINLRSARCLHWRNRHNSKGKMNFVKTILKIFAVLSMLVI
jgi:hypothetical protein